MFENVILYLGFLFSAAAAFLYTLAVKNKSKIKYAEVSYYISSGFVVLTSILLMANILAHNFQIAYIYEHSSRALPQYLLYSSFFAGQEGSFLLWALMLALIGVYLNYSNRNNQSQAAIMSVFTMSLVFFLLLLVMKSPFEYIWDKYPGTFAFDFLPADGRSLNPILENFWLAIHPPFLFAGYALLAVPFSYAVASILLKDKGTLVLKSRKWLLVSSSVLGAGLILGGFWAYETLGWGGWWGWDPVENSSLIPWLITVGLIHTLLMQKLFNDYRRINIFITVITYFFVIYSTFLTRSGVIQTSQHSFTGTAGSVFYVLLLGMALIIIIPTIIFLFNRDKTEEYPAAKLSGVKLFLSIGAYLVFTAAFFVAFGTSLPIFTSSITVEPNDTLTMPIAIASLIVILNILFYKDMRTNKKRAIAKIIASALSSIVILVISYNYGVTDLYFLLFLFLALLICFYSLANILFYYKDKSHSLFSQTAHLGYAVLCIGIIFSGKYSDEKTFSLANDEKANFAGMEIQYIKSEQIDKHLLDREKYHFVIKVKSGDDSVYLNPLMFIKNEQIYKEPSIYSGFAKDIYAAPLALDSVNNVPVYELSKGKPVRIMNTDIEIRFDNFIMAAAEEGKVGAMFDYKIGGKWYKDTSIAEVWLDAKGCNPDWKKFPGTALNFGLVKIVLDPENRANSKAVFALAKDEELPIQKREVFTFELSIKPFISLVWIGSILIILGTFLAVYSKRYRKAVA